MLLSSAEADAAHGRACPGTLRHDGPPVQRTASPHATAALPIEMTVVSSRCAAGGRLLGRLHFANRPAVFETHAFIGNYPRGVGMRCGPPRRCLALALALVVAGLPAPAWAARILSVHASRHGSHFAIAVRMALDAPPWAVFAALQDYAAMPRYNPDLRRVRIVPTAQPHRVRLFATVHACVWIFCKTLHQQQIMTATPDARGGVLRAALVPHGGDFRSGRARWTVRPCRDGPAPTCLDMQLELQPAFWVPPLIGAWIIRHKMYQEARRSGVGLERVAAKLMARSPAAPHRPG